MAHFRIEKLNCPKLHLLAKTRKFDRDMVNQGFCKIKECRSLQLSQMSVDCTVTGIWSIVHHSGFNPHCSSRVVPSLFLSLFAVIHFIILYQNHSRKMLYLTTPAKNLFSWTGINHIISETLEIFSLFDVFSISITEVSRRAIQVYV